MIVKRVIWILSQTYQTKESHQVHHGRENPIQQNNQVTVLYTIWYYESNLNHGDFFSRLLEGRVIFTTKDSFFFYKGIHAISGLWQEIIITNILYELSFVLFQMKNG
jgi:hypothetical protein